MWDWICILKTIKVVVFQEIIFGHWVLNVLNTRDTGRTIVFSLSMRNLSRKSVHAITSKHETWKTRCLTNNIRKKNTKILLTNNNTKGVMPFKRQQILSRQSVNCSAPWIRGSSPTGSSRLILVNAAMSGSVVLYIWLMWMVKKQKFNYFI